jgi:hypothetical protein
MKTKKETKMRKNKNKTLGQLLREKLFALPKKPTLNQRMMHMLYTG